MANPTTYTQEKADFVLRCLADGMTIPQIVRADPSLKKETIRDWRKANQEFGEAYDLAMKEGCFALMDETVDIADDLSEDPASRKVRIWTRHELAARKWPERMGARMQLANDKDNPLTTRSDADIDARIAELMAKANSEKGAD